MRPYLSALLPCLVACSGTGAAAPDAGTAAEDDAGTRSFSDGDATTPTSETRATHFVACLTSLSPGQVDRAFHFYAETIFTPKATGGFLSLSLSPLKAKAAGAAATVSTADVVGTKATLDDAPTSANGAFLSTIATLYVPAEANPISAREVQVDNATFAGRWSPGRFCTQLSGRVRAPLDGSLSATENTCIFVPVKEGDPVPALPASDFENGCRLD